MAKVTCSDLPPFYLGLDLLEGDLEKGHQV